MFSKAKNSKSNDANAQNAPLAEAQAPSVLAQSQNSGKKSAPMKASGVPSIISADVVMRGNINSSGEIQFDGALEGDVKASSLIIGEKASVKGEVICETVIVRGAVEGGIRAKSVSLAATARIQGDILHSSLSVETGAHFEGNCRHSDDPLSDASAKDFRRARPSTSGPTPRPAVGAETASDEQSAKPATNGSSPTFLSTQNNRSPLR